MEINGKEYILNQCTTDLFDWASYAQPNQYTMYYDKIVFKTENNKFFACYKDNTQNVWEI